MSGQDATQQLAPGQGHLWVANYGTAAPTDESSTPSGFYDLGFVTENGVQLDDQPAFRDQTAWQQLFPLGKIKTGQTIQLTFELKQWNRTSYAFAHGGGAWTNPSGSTWLYTPPAGASAPDYRAFILDATDGTYKYRWVFARGLNDSQVQTKLVRTDDALLPITFSITPINDATPPYLFYMSNTNA